MIRVTTGCVTCRIRRVKCDESKPTCKRCASTGRVCEGYVNGTISRKPRARKGEASATLTILTRNPTNPVFNASEDVDGFDFFRSHTVPSITMNIQSDFWSRLVPQLCQVEPAVMHSVLALTALHRHYHSSAEQDEYRATLQYNKAVKQMADVMSEAIGSKAGANINKILTCIILFHCIEMQVGNYPAAAMHLQGGFSILEEQHALRPSNSRTPWERVASDIPMTLRRLDWHNMTINDLTAPYAFSETPLNDWDVKIMPESLSSLQHAFDLLLDLQKWSMHIDEDLLRVQQQEGFVVVDTAYWADQWSRCNFQIQQWGKIFQDFKQGMKPAVATHSKQTLLLLELYFRLMEMPRSHPCAPSQMIWDDMAQEFHALLDMTDDIIACQSAMPAGGSEALGLFTTEPGIIAPIGDIIFRSRDPGVRKRALETLLNCRRREGPIDSEMAYAFCKRAVELEEDGLSPQVAQDIPEHKRILTGSTLLLTSDRTVHVEFILPAGPLDEECTDGNLLLTIPHIITY